MEASIYPQSPSRVPAGLTALTSSYQLRAFLAILAIILFFILYTALVVSLGYLAYYAVIYDMGDVNRLTILMKIGAIAGAAMLFLFTLKFIFKLKNHRPENRIKLPKKDYPQLWDYVYKICQETGAPKPKAIYADPDVNAYVAYSNVWLSLFLPVRKELTIGLGLVSCLNQSEFKAVVSHEFGHFAQRSMKIGSYILSANTIIHDMIFSRDRWDNILDQWRASDIRLSAAAWVITPIIWVIRQVLSLFYQFLNIMHSSLSREMEFNADKVAVSTSGSDAIISALWKLNDGAATWNETIRHAYLAAQKKVFSPNLYTHNNLALERIADKQELAFNNLPEHQNGGKKFFSESQNSKVNMYASHPPNDLREKSAKSPYVECETDDRSPWNLFPKENNLQGKMTQLVYQQYIKKIPDAHVEIEQFEDFITEETAGKELLAEYFNTFENRFFYIPQQAELETVAEKIGEPTVSDLTELKSQLITITKPVQEIDTLLEKAFQIANGATNEKSFSFKGVSYNKQNLQEGYNALLVEREKLYAEDFKSWDLSFCALHWSLAKKLNKEGNLQQLYRQHISIISVYQAIVNTKNTIFRELEGLQARNDVTEVEVNEFGRRVNSLVVNLNEALGLFDQINFVPLSNIDSVQEMKEAIVDGGAFRGERGQIFENDGFNKIAQTLDSSLSHCQRIDQKSITAILLFHKELENGLKHN